MLGTASVSANTQIDSDLDGVVDALDKCQNTPFTDIVDVNGCSIKPVIKPVTKGRVNVSFGVDYLSNSTDNVDTTTIVGNTQVGYYYGNFSFNINAGYYSSDTDGYTTDGLLDTYVGLGYKLKPIKNLTLTLTTGAYLPTYDDDNNEVDYLIGAGLSYRINKLNLFGNYSYTFIGDEDDTNTIEYEDTTYLSAGIGYSFTKKLYISSYYTNSSSLYKVIDENVETVTVSAIYSFNKSFYTNIKYGAGLNDSSVDDTVSLYVGFNF